MIKGDLYQQKNSKIYGHLHKTRKVYQVINTQTQLLLLVFVTKVDNYQFFIFNATEVNQIKHIILEAALNLDVPATTLNHSCPFASFT